MATVKRTNKEIRKSPGRVDVKKLASFTDRDVERFAGEDDSDTSELGEPRYVPPRTDVRALRERLGLSQSEFARRYLLSVRTVQQWEQEQREPSEPARVLLFAIARNPRTVERVLRSR
jgi:putative transcriptional regulator